MALIRVEILGLSAMHCININAFYWMSLAKTKTDCIRPRSSEISIRLQNVNWSTVVRRSTLHGSWEAPKAVDSVKSHSQQKCMETLMIWTVTDRYQCTRIRRWLEAPPMAWCPERAASPSLCLVARVKIRGPQRRHGQWRSKCSRRNVTAVN